VTVSEAAPAPKGLARRLAPLQLAVGLQGFVLWVPVEKLFMTQIGFTPRSVAVMAAAYAAVVPLFEVPSGILADRWSRNKILVCASLALLASSLLGGLSRDVATYTVAAMILGIYFALSSGTVDSVVYDTVLEETGGSELYELWIGRVRMVESGAFVISALAGGLLAGWSSPRVTYFATLPFVAATVLLFGRFREPQLHRQGEAVGLRQHVALTYQTMVRDPHVRQVILLVAVVGMLSQAVFEFGPLWLVDLHAPAALFGPYWAVLVSTLGIGGYLSGRLSLRRPGVVALIAVAAPASAALLTFSRALVPVIAAQTVLALLLAVLGIHAGKLLHDGVSSHLRTGVSSGAGTLSWLLFLPFSVAFGWYAHRSGLARAGWFLTGAATLIVVLLLAAALRRPQPAPSVSTATTDVVCQDLVELAAGYLNDELPADLRARVLQHLSECDGCGTYLTQLGFTVEALAQSPGSPPASGTDDPAAGRGTRG
jgi:predicted MFS family arabinose efflux permease